jgi:aromatic-L-amino-acid/L-tryptophan decarboxylase
VSGPELDPAQSGLGDMGPEELRAHGHRVVDWIADYLAGVGERPVLAQVSPGEVRAGLPAAPPEDPEPFDTALDDLDAVIMPGITHWNHPAFHAYFAITGSGPGILGEALTAALNVNGMLWRTSPSATELEEAVVDWLRQMLGLPGDLRGVILDTASVATMVSLAAARERADLDVRQRGLAGRPELPPLRIYTSQEAHSSVEKAAITLGLGRDGVRTVATDEQRRMDPDALAGTIREDVRFGYRPIAIVATVGTTSTTAVDPVPAIADLRDELEEELGHDLWLHVDGAYGAMAALAPELRWVLDGVERADALVTNPHKWLFTPIDCSVLLLRDVDVLTRAFSVVPEYLTADDGDVTDFMNWGVQLGRRFRALKLWLVIRYFGHRGLVDRIRHHVEQARRVADWVAEHPDLVLMAPAPLSTVCFRAEPDWSEVGAATDEDPDPKTRALNELNRRWLDGVNATGEAFLSHTDLDGRMVLRLATGSLRTTDERLERTLGVLARQLVALRP